MQSPCLRWMRFIDDIRIQRNHIRQRTAFRVALGAEVGTREAGALSWIARPNIRRTDEAFLDRV